MQFLFIFEYQFRFLCAALFYCCHRLAQQIQKDIDAIFNFLAGFLGKAHAIVLDFYPDAVDILTPVGDTFDIVGYIQKSCCLFRLKLSQITAGKQFGDIVRDFFLQVLDDIQLIFEFFICS